MAIIKIKPNDRMCIVGETGCGKTYLVTGLLDIMAANNCHVIVLDNKGRFGMTKDKSGKFKFSWKGAGQVSSLEGCLQAQKMGLKKIVFRPPVELTEGSKEFYEVMDSFYWWNYKRENCIVYTDEATAVCDSHNILPGHQALMKRGRELNIGCWNSTQEPVNVHNTLLSQAEHNFMFTVKMESHRKKMAGFMGDDIMIPLKKDYKFWYYNPEEMESPELQEPIKF